jgi:hypothetical protein
MSMAAYRATIGIVAFRPRCFNLSRGREVREMGMKPDLDLINQVEQIALGRTGPAFCQDFEYGITGRQRSSYCPFVND